MSLAIQLLNTRRRPLALVVLTLLCGGFNLAYSPGISVDEGWVLQAPHNLLQYGIYGTWPLDGPLPFDPDITTGPAVLLPITALFAVFGEGVLQARLVTVAYSVLAVLAFYAAALRTVDRRVALLAAALLSLSLYPLNRSSLGEVPGLFWLLTGAIVWLDAYRDDAHLRYLAAGLCFGLAALCKLALAPIAAGAVIACWLFSALLSGQRRSLAAVTRPLLTIAGVLALWYGFQGLVVGFDGLFNRLGALAGYQPQNLSPSAPRALKNAVVLLITVPFAALPWWVAGLVLAPWRLRLRLLRDPEYCFWVVLLAACGGFYIVSIGWPRYAFWAMAVGMMGVAWVLEPFAGLVRPSEQRDRRRSNLGLGLAGLVLLSAPALAVWDDVSPRDDTGERTANYLLANAAATDRVGTTEWELDFLTGRRLRHPPPYTLPVSQAVLDATFDWSWPGMNWVALGNAGQAFGAQARLRRTQGWEPRFTAGAYTVYQRAGG